jgi:SNF2 family DNA or RNA helicase
MIELFDHQKEAVEILLWEKSYILADDVGVGKTITALKTIDSAQVNTLIICPYGVMKQWETEANLGAPVLIINYEKILNKEIYSMLFDCNINCIILDEGHRIRNIKGKRSIQIRHLTDYLKPDYRFILTGTPIRNRFSDLLALFDFIDENEMEIISNNKYDTSSNHDVISRNMLRRKLAILPKPTSTIIWSELLPVQQEAYYKAEIELRVLINDEYFPINHAFALITRLRQISNALNILQPSKYINSSKMFDLFELIDDIVIANNYKMIIFSEWITTCKLISTWINRRYHIKCHMLNGETKNATALKNDFNKNGKILIATASGEEGHNLQSANYIVNFDLPYDPQRVHQRIGRINRIGQKNDTHVITLLTDTPIERNILDIIYKKQDIFDTFIESKTELINIDEHDLIRRLIQCETAKDIV